MKFSEMQSNNVITLKSADDFSIGFISHLRAW